HIEGLPLGTVGGTMIHRTFPLDGEYAFQVKLFRTNLNATRGLEHPHQLEVTVDGARVFLITVGGEADLAASRENSNLASEAIEAKLRVRLAVKAGERAVGVAFLQTPPTQDTQPLQPYLRSSADTLDATGRPHIESLTITGPFNATGPGDAP